MLSEDSFKLAKIIKPIKKNKICNETNIFLKYFHNELNKIKNVDNIISEIKFNNDQYNFNSYSSYLASDIKSQIQNINYKSYNFKFKIQNTNFDIKFLTIFDVNIDILYFYLKQIYMFYSLIGNLSFLKNKKNFKIVIFFSNIKKQIPNNNIYVLKTNNVNTGYTYCNSNEPEIVLYRNEEWFKVLIHETMHAVGLDFCNINNKKINTKILEIFPVEIELNLYETYCEVWANILNITFVSYNNTSNYSEFKNLFSHYYNFEKHFQIFQMNKVLNFMNLNYDDLYKKEEKYEIKRKGFYREKTNVFCYYILKSILFYNLSEFLEYCKNNNRNYLFFSKTEKNLLNFVSLIEKYYKNKTFLDLIKIIFEKYNSKISKNSNAQKSLRLTMFDFVKLY